MYRNLLTSERLRLQKGSLERENIPKVLWKNKANASFHF